MATLCSLDYYEDRRRTKRAVTDSTGILFQTPLCHCDDFFFVRTVFDKSFCTLCGECLVELSPVHVNLQDLLRLIIDDISSRLFFLFCGKQNHTEVFLLTKLFFHFTECFLTFFAVTFFYWLSRVVTLIYFLSYTLL